MASPPPSVLDEIYGAQALGEIFAADLEGAVKALDRASTRYLPGFFCRLALLSPGIALHLAGKVARLRIAWLLPRG